jgi:carnitine-CoA ligase
MTSNPSCTGPTQLPDVHPYIGQDLARALDARASRHGDRPFLLWAPHDRSVQQWSYLDFATATRTLAAHLRDRGVTEHDLVLIKLANSPELLLTLFACGRLGATAVTVNADSSLDELSYFASHSGATCAVTQPSYASEVRACSDVLRWVAVVDHDGGVPAQAPDWAVPFAALITGAADFEDRPADPSRDLTVQYTSGTTSRPKGVVWTHANALWAGQVNASHTGLVPDDRYLVQLPLFHTNALSYSVLGSFWVGATVVLVPRFSASRFWPVSLEHHCTVTSMVPFCLRALAALPVPPEHDYRVWGSPICDPPLADELFRVKSVGWWGMTETVSHGIVGDPYEANTPLSCGRPTTEYELRILHPDGTPVSSGETGALQIRGIPGLSLFSRYLNDPEATAGAFDGDGYFLTGDRVTLMADGHIQFSDRDKDMLKVGGENVAASEIERVMQAVPGVSEVAVVARPDAMLGEVPHAFVVAQPDVDHPALITAIEAACIEKLARFKQPKAVEIVDDLPRSTLNKVAKAELRRRLVDMPPLTT